MTKQEFDKEMSRLKKLNTQKEYQNKLKAEKNKYCRKLETSKLLAIYLFAVLNIIVIFAMVVMWHFADLTYLGVLITDIAAQILIYGIYCLKAYKGKKSEEEMKFKRESISGTLSDLLNAGGESESEVPIVVGTSQVLGSNTETEDSSVIECDDDEIGMIETDD